jgi:proteasome lid subunit RPN8/RPN11
VTIADGVVAAIFEHARLEAPRECCGLLIGASQHIRMAVRARNIAQEPHRRYLIDPHDHLAAIRLARQSGNEVIGAYHSHPRSAAVPSPTDTAEGFAHFLFVIAGMDGTPEVTAWSWHDGNFTAVPLVRVP